MCRIRPPPSPAIIRMALPLATALQTHRLYGYFADMGPKPLMALITSFLGNFHGRNTSLERSAFPAIRVDDVAFYGGLFFNGFYRERK
jgi:hypothetical protein